AGLRSDMSKAHTSGARFGGCAGSGSGSMAAPSGAGLLSLGGAPGFALVALWAGLFGQPDILCMSMHTFSLHGVRLMYTLMSIFQAAPWMKLISSRRIGAPPAQPAVCLLER